MKIFIVLLLLLSTQMMNAKIINKVTYEGLVHISEPVALRMLSFEMGEDINDKQLNKTLQKYFNQGYFNDVWASFNGDVLEFHFKEKTIISQVELQGWEEEDEDVLKSVVGIKKGTLYDEVKLKEAKQRIIDTIAKEGLMDTVVEIEKEYLENGSLKVTFLVNKGDDIIIEKLRYNGVKKLDSEDFDSVIANKEHEFMGWVWGRNDGKLNLENLKYDNQRIRDFYMQHGYLDAKVDKAYTKVNFDDYTAELHYKVQEGEEYIVSDIVIEQENEIIKNSKLKKLMILQKNKAFNINRFRKDSQKIKTMIADLGYAYVRVLPDFKKNVKEHTVKVTYRVIAGVKVKIRNVLISGNNRTLDRIIRRELYLGPGDTYSLTDLKDSKTALGRLGFFDSNSIEEKRITNEVMDLIVKVKEAPTGNLQIGGGYGNYSGVLMSVSVNDRNIWGSGISVGVKAEKSETTTSYSFNVANSRLNDSDFNGNFSIFYSDSDYNDYSVITQGVSVGAGHRFSRHISAYLGYSYSQNAYVEGSTFATSSIDDFFFEDYTKSSINVSTVWDNTDDYYLPREGFTLSQYFEKSGVGASANFLKSKTKFSTYFGLEDYIDMDIIVRYKAKLNFIINNGFIPLAEKFYLGGLGSVRGYQSYSISPTVYDTKGDLRRVGARQTFSNSFELSFPLLKAAKIRLVSFLDWGMIGDENIHAISKSGYGAGIEWFSPVGPIQLMFGNPINPESNDKISRFDFTMGQRF